MSRDAEVQICAATIKDRIANLKPVCRPGVCETCDERYAKRGEL